MCVLHASSTEVFRRFQYTQSCAAVPLADCRVSCCPQGTLCPSALSPCPRSPPFSILPLLDVCAWSSVPSGPVSTCVLSLHMQPWLLQSACPTFPLSARSPQTDLREGPAPWVRPASPTCRAGPCCGCRGSGGGTWTCCAPLSWGPQAGLVLPEWRRALQASDSPQHRPLPARGWWWRCARGERA